MVNASTTARKLHNQLLLFEHARDDRERSDSAPFVARAAREHLAEAYGLTDGTKEERNRAGRIIAAVGDFMRSRTKKAKYAGFGGSKTSGGQALPRNRRFLAGNGVNPQTEHPKVCLFGDSE